MNLVGMKSVLKVRGLMNMVKLVKGKDQDYKNKINELKEIFKTEKDLPDRFQRTVKFQVSLGNIRGIVEGRTLETRCSHMNNEVNIKNMSNAEVLDNLHKLITDIKKYIDTYGQLA